MKIKLTLAPEDAAIVHNMYLHDELDDIGVVGLTVLSEASDKDIIALQAFVHTTLDEEGHITKSNIGIDNHPRWVFLVVPEDHSTFDDAAFFGTLSRILMKQIVTKSMWAFADGRGRTTIQAAMTPPELMRLLKLYKDGHLDDLNIAMITTDTDLISGGTLDGGSKDYWKKHYVDFLTTGRTSILPVSPRPGPARTQKSEKH